MFNAENCKDIDEIRCCIDSIDQQIITLLAQRGGYINSAAQFKLNTSEVEAPNSVKQMLEMRRNWAVECGLSPDFIEELYSYIISYFDSGKMDHFEGIQRSNKQITICRADLDDAPLILTLQKRAFLQEAEKIGNFNIIPIMQNLESLIDDFSAHVVFKALYGQMIVGSIRVKEDQGICYIGRLIVEPVFQKRGIGTTLMNYIENLYSCNDRYELFTGENSPENIRFYSKLGYCIKERFESKDGVKLVRMIKFLS